jgi:chemotaxis protein MotB
MFLSHRNTSSVEGSPEWIMSYADMVTILMAFFVILYSMAGSEDTAKEQAMLRSLRLNLGPFKGLAGPLISKKSKFAEMAVAPQPPQGENRDGDPARRDSTPAKVPRVDPTDPVASGGMVRFEEGGTDLSPDNERQLAHIAQALAGKPQCVEIRGHTSRRPLAAGSPYRDSWELAFARGRKAMEFLVAHGIERARIRLSVASHPAQVPRGESKGPEDGDARVDIFMLGEFPEADDDRGAAKRRP